MTFDGRNRRGNFGRVRREIGSADANTSATSARMDKYLQQERTSKRVEGVLKSSAPKDTEVNANTAATDSDLKPSCSVEFRTKYFERRKDR
jgi:hypothetical protein